MVRLEDLKQGARVLGILPDAAVTVVNVRWHGSTVVELTYRTDDGKLGNELLYRDNEAGLSLIEPGRAWAFDGDGSLLKLVSEARRIQLAHLFDPLFAVHTSLVEPLPHQITAVYEEMLPRQPMRFLLADDPGSGKTIMAGLLMRELVIRGDLKRCLICCPGNLATQWQDELLRRFNLQFDIISSATIEESATGNPYREKALVISRLDHMSRNERIQAMLRETEWDLVVVDEAHKMSAHYYGNEVKETMRYKLGRLLGSPERTRHLLFLTATPHSGREEDFQLFMALLDADRFEGRFREGVHVTDTRDLMRRLVKEQLVKFDGTPLFPERRAYTVKYDLSPAEAQLYAHVTDYVRNEMNRADRLSAEGEGRRGNRVGFALTTLQRRLASSPEAIYKSLQRRRERLEKRLREEKLRRCGRDAELEEPDGLPDLDDDYLLELEDAPNEEVERTEDMIVEQASAARTITELEAEIATLKTLEAEARQVWQQGTDRKWEELSRLIQNRAEMFDGAGLRRKLIIFSEHLDTINYLVNRIQPLLGRPEEVVVIHGGLGRDERQKVQELFTQDKDVHILVATDAAGEGINLQRAHLLVNYDLPWNPNRLEQRFGRIHRIGQTEVCHMWSLVAHETREGEVYYRLLQKLIAESQALGGGVFDVLGKVFEGNELRKLIIEAIRYGDQPEVKARQSRVLDDKLDREHLRNLLEEHALAHDAMDAAKVRRVREEMERAEARRMQPHYIRAFFIEAFRYLGGTIHEREPRRFEIRHVPAALRQRDRLTGTGGPLLTRYERVCFDKELMNLLGKPLAEFITPGHPLLDAVIDLLLERSRDVLKRGAVLVDPNDTSDRVRMLFYLEHALQDGRLNRDGSRRVISKRLQFMEMDRDGNIRSAGAAPYLDYEPISDEDRQLIAGELAADWLGRDVESRILQYAAEHLIPAHLEEVRSRKLDLIARTAQAVKERLSKEINYWDNRANQLSEQELAGRPNARMNSAKARQRADELAARMKKRLAELEQERSISPLPPLVVGGALIVPQGLLARLRGGDAAAKDKASVDRKAVERLALDAVMAAERRLGRVPRDVSDQNVGYDIESAIPGTGRLLFIEVKGRAEDADIVTVTRNEILTGLNKPDEYILAIVPVVGKTAGEPVYIRAPFQREPDFGAASVNYALSGLLARGVEPC